MRKLVIVFVVLFALILSAPAKAATCNIVPLQACANGCEALSDLFNQAFGPQQGFTHVKKVTASCTSESASASLTSCLCDLGIGYYTAGIIPHTVNGYTILWEEDMESLEVLVCNPEIETCE